MTEQYLRPILIISAIIGAFIVGASIFVPSFKLNDTLEAESQQSIAVSSLNITDPKHVRFCNMHASVPQFPKCYINNTYCGDWNLSTRTFIPAINPATNSFDPDQCQLRHFTAKEARQCIGNRSLAFAGDSQLRDLSTAIGLFLQGMTAEESLDIKFDHQDKFALDGWIDMIPFIELWYNQSRGWIFPSSNRSHFTEVTNRTADADKYEFQVQYWELYTGGLLFDTVNNPSMTNQSRLVDVAKGDIVKDPMVQKYGARKADYIFCNHGLHEWGWWVNERLDPVDRFFSNMYGEFGKQSSFFPIPAVWVSLNSECDYALGHQTVGGHSAVLQVNCANRVNQELGGRLKSIHKPYYDADLVLRSPALCNVTGDGVHVKMWTDLVRAQLFFNYLCDENNMWAGDRMLAFFQGSPPSPTAHPSSRPSRSPISNPTRKPSSNPTVTRPSIAL